MADFIGAYERMMAHEGGARIVIDHSDSGGMTFAGIARNYWPNWEGWKVIDTGGKPDEGMVQAFYRDHFWQPLNCDLIASQRIAASIFDFAVNAGIKAAVTIAQSIVGETMDGKLGPKTLAALNSFDEDLFLARYALGKISRYVAIVMADRAKIKYLIGWIVRALDESK